MHLLYPLKKWNGINTIENDLQQVDLWQGWIRRVGYKMHWDSFPLFFKYFTTSLIERAFLACLPEITLEP